MHSPAESQKTSRGLVKIMGKPGGKSARREIRHTGAYSTFTHFMQLRHFTQLIILARTRTHPENVFQLITLHSHVFLRQNFNFDMKNILVEKLKVANKLKIKTHLHIWIELYIFLQE